MYFSLSLCCFLADPEHLYTLPHFAVEMLHMIPVP